jgi:hypothetical protein
MPLQAPNIRVGLSGAVYKAPFGTVAPTNATTALTVAYVDLGYLSDDGVTEAWADSSQDIKAWQAATVVRSAVTGSSGSLSFTLIETKGSVLAAFHRGSAVVESPVGTFKLAVKPIVSDPACWVLHVIDGLKLIRMVVNNGEIIERGDIMYKNGEPVGYPVKLQCYPDLNGELMIKWSNDTAWGYS